MPPITSAWPGRSSRASSSGVSASARSRSGELERDRVDPAEGRLTGGNTSLELRQERARIGAGQRNARARDGTGLAERTQRPRCDERVVDGQRHDDVVAGGTHACEEAVDGRPLGDAVVDDRERKRRSELCLADDQHLVAGLGEEAMSSLRERLAAEPGERLGRAEPARGAADEQHPGERGHASIRCGSV